MVTPLREVAGMGAMPAGALHELKALSGRHTQDLGALQTWMLLLWQCRQEKSKSRKLGLWTRHRETSPWQGWHNGRKMWQVNGSPSLPNNGD